MTSQTRRPLFESSPPWKPQISHGFFYLNKNEVNLCMEAICPYNSSHISRWKRKLAWSTVSVKDENCYFCLYVF